MIIKIVEGKITREELKNIAEETFKDMLKATVDIKKGSMAVGGELHIDSNDLLIKSGSNQTDVWGLNIYPEKEGEEFLEFNSLINIKPTHGNRSADIQNDVIKTKIASIVSEHIQ